MRRRLAGVLLAAACVLAFLPQWWGPVLAPLCAVVGAALVDRSTVRSALRVTLVLAALFAAAAAGGVVAWSQGWERGLVVGGGMLARLLVLWLVAGVLSRVITADTVLRWTGALGLKHLGLVFGLALNSLPHLVSAARDVWIGHRTRAGSRLGAWLRLPLLGEVLLAHTARIAEDAAGAAALRGHSILSRGGDGGFRCAAPIVVLTGRPGIGKTPVLERVVERLRDGGINCSGLIQPGIFEEGKKVGFLIRDLRSGAEAELARRVERSDGEHGTRYTFNEEGRRLAEEALDALPGGGIFVVDELGPVELRGRGHMPALKRALAARRPNLLIVTVRRHLVPVLLAELSATDARVVDVEIEGERTVEVLLGLVGDSAPREADGSP